MHLTFRSRWRKLVRQVSKINNCSKDEAVKIIKKGLGYEET